MKFRRECIKKFKRNEWRNGQLITEAFTAYVFVSMRVG